MPHTVQNTLNYCLIKISFTAEKNQTGERGKGSVRATFTASIGHRLPAMASPESRSAKGGQRNEEGGKPSLKEALTFTQLSRSVDLIWRSTGTSEW